MDAFRKTATMTIPPSVWKRRGVYQRATLYLQASENLRNSYLAELPLAVENGAWNFEELDLFCAYLGLFSKDHVEVLTKMTRTSIAAIVNNYTYTDTMRIMEILPKEMQLRAIIDISDREILYRIWGSDTCSKRSFELNKYQQNVSEHVGLKEYGDADFVYLDWFPSSWFESMQECKICERPYIYVEGIVLGKCGFHTKHQNCHGNWDCSICDIHDASLLALRPVYRRGWRRECDEWFSIVERS